jgi:UDP-glucose 4-epimerase
MKVLLTGGLGFIGSHTAVELLAIGHEVVLVDNLSNSKQSVLERLEKITGKTPIFEQVDVCSLDSLGAVFETHKPDAVIHFAALKAVGESVKNPLAYYQNNLDGLLNVCTLMHQHGVNTLIFSSSATVYGDPKQLPIPETAPLEATNPYGQTKLMGEQILRDFAVTDSNLRITLLRYFNPIGAHESGLIGEDPNDIPNNLLPYVAKVASGELKELHIFGNDYPTPDGTGVRDYIHVVDLAKGHVAALEHGSRNTIATYNLGSGNGYSVLEVVAAFEEASGKKIAYKIVDRRPGDIASCYADPTKANQELSWHTTKDLLAMCQDAWRWQQYTSKELS